MNAVKTALSASFALMAGELQIQETLVYQTVLKRIVKFVKLILRAA